MAIAGPVINIVASRCDPVTKVAIVSPTPEIRGAHVLTLNTQVLNPKESIASIGISYEGTSGNVTVVGGNISFLFTNAGESYEILVSASNIPVGLEIPPTIMGYTVTAEYAPAWASIDGLLRFEVPTENCDKRTVTAIEHLNCGDNTTPDYPSVGAHIPISYIVYEYTLRGDEYAAGLTVRNKTTCTGNTSLGTANYDRGAIKSSNTPSAGSQECAGSHYSCDNKYGNDGVIVGGNTKNRKLTWVSKSADAAAGDEEVSELLIYYTAPGENTFAGTITYVNPCPGDATPEYELQQDIKSQNQIKLLEEPCTQADKLNRFVAGAGNLGSFYTVWGTWGVTYQDENNDTQRNTGSWNVNGNCGSLAHNQSVSYCANGNFDPNNSCNEREFIACGSGEDNQWSFCTAPVSGPGWDCEEFNDTETVTASGGTSGESSISGTLSVTFKLRKLRGEGYIRIFIQSVTCSGSYNVATCAFPNLGGPCDPGPPPDPLTCPVCSDTYVQQEHLTVVEKIYGCLGHKIKVIFKAKLYTEIGDYFGHGSVGSYQTWACEVYY